MKILTNIAQTLNANDLNIPQTSGSDALANGLHIAYFAAGIVAVLAIVIAGFTMVAGGSDPATVAKAKNTILYAIIGLVVVISAALITQFFIGRLG
jgi:hypothetical protein